ncbi:hypothetical protein [Polyangium jinanense]|uniref:HYR domain-containing protein n=1 Tax=Polyangium jinanense TaxID=2829994 RepID=A0A9X3XH35_9BACT|nr:hypothetical protein [Polyangium jinanense]MDC3958433.1 hypothetical protein [Polyangium jinanense]MDC3987986.1 hypothetical protein [Polyangium jinanense]
MRRRRRSLKPLLFVLAGLATGAAIAAGCSATSTGNKFDPGEGGSGGVGASGGGGGSPTSSSSGMGGEGGFIFPTDDGGTDAPNDVPVNPCGTKCGPTELCDPDHLGSDDDCDGEADEDCPCSAGQAHPCFKGDPSYRGTPGCFDGTMKCSENGYWSSCIGGVHATDLCFLNDTNACHAMTTSPFVNVNLKDGTGNFSADAVPGSETWAVACPDGVSPCPGVSGSSPADDFKPLQSGEYTVTYTKGLAGGGTATCTYPLFVGAPGLRVELEWEHNLGGDGVDLDLHLHQPNNTLPWAVSGSPQDCAWSNCVFSDFTPPPSIDAPSWFPANVQPPEPVSWYLDPTFEKNTCYFAPRGVGQDWQILGQGCHNPRLDLDNISCDPTVSNPDDSDFCAPENVNVDFPPKNQWFRIGVHYFSNDDKTYDVHPTIKIFCDGALSAELGPKGYYDPETPITFTPTDGEGLSGGNRFWLVADVAFRESNQCGARGCVVKPLYSDEAAKTPLLTYDDIAEQNFGPAYPPPLQ